MGLSAWQIGLVVLIFILLFGRGKIPALMTDLAEGIKGFKKGIKDESAESDEQPDSIGRDASKPPSPSLPNDKV